MGFFSPVFCCFYSSPFHSELSAAFILPIPTLIPFSFPFPFFFNGMMEKVVPHSFLQLLWLLHLMFSDFRSGSPRGCPSGELYRCRKEQVFLFSKVCVVSALPGV